jgi:hypothetical protein
VKPKSIADQSAPTGESSPTGSGNGDVVDEAKHFVDESAKTRKMAQVPVIAEPYIAAGGIVAQLDTAKARRRIA